ncbi:MAG: tryptophan 7-halogenase [Proteobacteria bacterium]|nr:tryptophan 7-halogenase [Pseudomonadota bacterium]
MPCDVLVIGGGPAGATVAPLLAERGYRVVLLDKDRHPRFHIGESLLPANLPLLERLGVADEMRAIGMHKPGAEFVSPQHGHTQTFYFADAWDKSMPSAYQVRRAEFDAMLLENAARKGVQVHQGCKATQVEFDADGSVRVQSRSDDGSAQRWRARFLIDASGRDTFLANRFRIKERNPQHNSSALYAHFRGAQRHGGTDEGNISILWFEHGWFWFIPMTDGVTSVGMVTWPYHMKTRRGRSLEQFLQDNIATCPELARRLASAERVTKVEATGNFSYAATRNHGRNYLMLGDAFAFIDPVFSSGVWLAMQGGVVGAETVDVCLRQPRQAAAALRRFDRISRHGPRQFSWFIYRMTNPIMRDFFMYPKNVLRVKEALLSVLAGDVYGGTPIWRSLLAFKGLYYAANLLQPRRAYRAWKKRRHNIRTVDDAGLYQA